MWEEDLIIPPVICNYLRGGRLHASGHTTEYGEFYLYTYNAGLDSTSGVLVTIDVYIPGINMGL